MRPRNLFLAAGLSLALAMAGCATDPRKDLIAELGVEVATLRFVGDSPERAERVREAVQLVAAVMEWQDVSTIEALHFAVVRVIDLDRLQPVEQALARTLIQLVVADLNLVAPDGVFTEVTLERLRNLLAAIERGASYVVAEGKA